MLEPRVVVFTTGHKLEVDGQDEAPGERKTSVSLMPTLVSEDRGFIAKCEGDR